MTGRGTMYSQSTIIAVTLLGFVIAAVAILVSMDPRRPIVDELRRGESFTLLILNMLVTIVGLFWTTAMALIGSLVDDSTKPAKIYETVFESVGLSTIFELMMTGFLFAVVTYKLA